MLITDDGKVAGVVALVSLIISAAQMAAITAKIGGWVALP